MLIHGYRHPSILNQSNVYYWRRPGGPDLRGPRGAQNQINWTLRHAWGVRHVSGHGSERVCPCNWYKRKKNVLDLVTRYGSRLARDTNWTLMGIDKDDLLDSRIRLSAAKKVALRVLGRTLMRALNMEDRTLLIRYLVVEKLDESGQFNLCRNFIRNFEVTIEHYNPMFSIRNPDRKFTTKPVNPYWHRSFLE